MTSEDWVDQLMPRTVDELITCHACPLALNTEKGLNLAGKQAVHQVLDELISLLFPGCHGYEPVPESDLESYLRSRLRQAALTLKEQVRRTLMYQCNVEHGRECRKCGTCTAQAQAAVARLVTALPELQRTLQRDIVAAYEGDPAARSTMETVMSYPGVYAIMVHRLAHVLYQENIPMIPGIMSEYAHSETGIDIHPGARIGAGFFIDHGTGVVLGETCVIGENVKLYQGVTLGALSFEKDEHGNPIKGIKRHPNVEDHVVIYAGATILGGETTIGHHSEIGGNVWLTHSVPPYSKVYNHQPKPLITAAGSGRRGPAAAPDDTGSGI